MVKRGAVVVAVQIGRQAGRNVYPIAGAAVDEKDTRHIIINALGEVCKQILARGNTSRGRARAAAHDVGGSAGREIIARHPTTHLSRSAAASPKVAAVGLLPAEAVVGVKSADHESAGVRTNIHITYS